MAGEYPHMPEVEVLLNGAPLPRELWRRYAVRSSDLLEAMTDPISYGCNGTVTVQRRVSGGVEPVNAGGGENGRTSGGDLGEF